MPGGCLVTNCPQILPRDFGEVAFPFQNEKPPEWASVVDTMSKLAKEGLSLSGD